MTRLEQAKTDIRAALDMLSQSKTYPGDIAVSRSHLTNALNWLIAEQNAQRNADAAMSEALNSGDGSYRP